MADGVARRISRLGGASGWLNSEPLTPDGLRGRAVVIQFCTFSLRQLAAPGSPTHGHWPGGIATTGWS
jgi:hypothetical protein